MASSTQDALVRAAAFEFLDELRQQLGDALPYHTLREGFEFDGRRVPLLGPQGIFKPAVLPNLPLSITTVAPKPGKTAPYDDELGDGGLIRYRYRGTDPSHRDNVGLRRAMQARVPLVYLYGLVVGRYVAAYPTYVVGDDPSELTFDLQIDQPAELSLGAHGVAEGTEARREYITVATKRRLHQTRFRERVLQAYRRCCAMCRLRHVDLLDAAHILPDHHERGVPHVSNGLALCKLHHAAFDRNIVGVRPDLVVEVAARVLEEIDGPMLRHGLQGLHGMALERPRRKEDRPNADAIDFRYQQFRATA